MLAEGYDFSGWRLLNISACLLGRLRELGTSKEVLGYIAVLTLLGCRRVCSALWPISDAAAPEFSRHWIRAIKRHVFGDTPPGQWSGFLRAGQLRPGAFGWWDEAHGRDAPELAPPEHPFEVRCRLVLKDVPGVAP